MFLRHNPKIICSLYASFIQMKYRSDMLQCNTINIAKECVPKTVMIGDKVQNKVNDF